MIGLMVKLYKLDGVVYYQRMGEIAVPTEMYHWRFGADALSQGYITELHRAAHLVTYGAFPVAPSVLDGGLRVNQNADDQTAWSFTEWGYSRRHYPDRCGLVMKVAPEPGASLKLLLGADIKWREYYDSSVNRSEPERNKGVFVGVQDGGVVAFTDGVKHELGSANIDSGRWNHIVINFTNGNIDSLFVNGVDTKIDTKHTSETLSFGFFGIGDRRYVGDVSDIVIYDTHLARKDIIGLMPE